jgi:hypothetical protein
MQLAFSRIILSRHRLSRPAAWCAAALILVTAWSGLPATVLAQSGSLPQVNAPGPLPAPIGHRQPRAQDLPPDVLRAEGMSPRPPEPAPTTRPDASRDQVDGRAAQTPLDDNQLQICRGC